jgi:hypothetical protein
MCDSRLQQMIDAHTDQPRSVARESDGFSARQGDVKMILATTKVEDVDRFLEVFGTKGAVKRAQHGSKGSTVFRDPSETDRVWALFDWDMDGWASFVSDPEVPAILKEAGHIGRPESGELSGQYDA